MATPILNVDDIFVNEGPNATATFVVRLSQPATAPASVGYFTFAGSASGVVPPIDYTNVNSTLDFAVGEQVKTITVPIISDTLVEAAESFSLMFTTPVNLTIGRTTAFATIIDDDTVSAAPLVFVGDVYVNETDGVAYFDITLTQASATAITVNYQTVAMTALAGSDFVGAASSVIFAPGEMTKTVTVQLLDDGAAEDDEKFGLQLTGATGGAVVGNPLGTATIEHNDGPTATTPTLNVSDVIVTEGPVAVATFVLSLSQPSAGITSVRYSLQSASAVSSVGTSQNVDFLNESSITVTFAPGETVKAVNVPITDDVAIEQAEIFFLSLSSPVGLALSRNLVPATIVDNDTAGAAPLVTVEDLYVNESDGEAHFTITLDRASTSKITVDFQTADLSAQAGSDYVAVKSSVVFLPGETATTVAVTLSDDAVAEIDERFALQLTGAAGGAVLFDSQATAVIEHNDGATAASPILFVDDIVVGENAPLTFVLRLGQPSAGAASVTYAISNGSASNTTDYWFTTDTVRFTPGETVKIVTIPNIDDAGVEQGEFLQLGLSSPQGMTLSKTRVMANIIDNDATGPTPLVTVSDAVVNESDGEVHFVVALDRASSTPITIVYKTVDGSAVAGSDFVSITSTVTFLPGDVAKTVSIQLLDDTQAETDEQFTVQLSNLTGGAVLADPMGTATIEHNDGITAASPILSVDDIVVSEGPNSFATFVLRLNQPSTSVATVSYTSEFSTAAQGADYWAVSDTIRFAPGETVKTVTIPIVDDGNAESTEAVRLNLFTPQGLTVAKTYAVGKVIDNDTIGANPLVLVGDALVNETDGFAHLAITLDRASTAAITVAFQTVNGSAAAGSDFVGVSSSVTFLPGETAKTIDVQLIDDGAADAEETFGLTLTGVTGGASLADADGEVTIGRSDGAVAAQPILNVADVVVGEGGDSMATFVLRLSQPSANVTSVSVTLTGGTAASTNDYLFMQDKLTFAAGETIKTFSVPIVQDSANEQAETFTLVMSSAQGIVLGRTLAFATIIDDDTTGAAPALSVGDVFVNESDGAAYFGLTLDRAATAPITVSFQTTDGLAVAGSRYVAKSGSIVFMPGETAKSVAVQLIDDGLIQADQTFSLQVTGVTGGAVVADGIGTALIARSDLPAVATPVLSVDDIVVSEGGLSLATFVLRLSQPSTGTASVGVSLGFGGTANFADYKEVSGTVTFGAGETVKTFTMPLVDDGDVEGAETLFLQFGSAQGLTLGQTKATATIIDNDGPVLAAGIDSVKAEGQGGSVPLTFSVILKQAMVTSQTLNWSVAGFGTHPASASDFAGGVLPTGSVTFAPGEIRKTVTVNVAGDTAFEGDETFVLSVTDPSATLGIGTVQVQGTIVDDDGPAATISATTASAAEGIGGPTLFTFTVSLNQAATTAQSVSWAVSGSGLHAASAADFAGGVLPSGTVNFGVGDTSKTFTVAVAGDSQFEADETFVVNVTSSSVPVGSFLAQATILNDDTLSVSIAAASATKAEGQAGATAFTFTMSLDAAAPSPLSVNWAVTGSGANAANAADFAGGVLPSGSVTFAAGESIKTITINAASDSAIEPDEGFVVTLSNPASGLTIGTATAGGTIVNDDATVSIAAAAASKAEGGGGGSAFTFTVTRSGDTSVAHSVAYTVSGTGGNPADGADFVGGVLPTGTVSFVAGETSKTVTVTVAGDVAPEADEGFIVSLSGPSAGLILGTASASGTILNDDTSISVAAALAARLEGSAGTTQFTFTVTQTGDTSAPHSVSYSVTASGPNPASAADFAGGVLPSGTVSFAAGETSKTITIDVVGDVVPEPDESFVVTLSSPSAGVTLGTASATGTILSDDASLSVAALSAVKAEGQTGTTSFTFTVTQTGDTSAPHAISYEVAGTGANAADAADFAGNALPSGTVTFGIGETSKTITILVAGDGAVEADESFAVTVSGPVGGPFVGSASATGTIVNDDASLSIAAASATKQEGQAGTTAFTFTVTQSGDLSISHSVSYAVGGTGANPASGADFAGGVLPAGSVTFAAGEASKTITIDVVDDALVEANETFSLNLSNPSLGLVLGTASATGTIQNDDASASIAALSASKPEGNAGATAFTFQVTLAGDASTPHSVSWAVTGTGADAAGAGDFVGGAFPAGTLSFVAGETTKTLTVNVAGDTALEATEGFVVTLSNPSVGLVLGTAAAIGTIQDDDSVPTHAYDDAFVVLQGQALHITAPSGVLANDTGGAPVSATLLTNASHGTLTLASNGGLDFTAAPSFTGIDGFTYRTSASAGTDDGQVHIHVVPVLTGQSTTLNLLALSPEEQIAATYAAFFGRAADNAGFEFWVGQFIQGLPVQGPAVLFANIASSFGVSTEAQNLYPFLANPFGGSAGQISTFLDSVYNNLFNRSSDAAGLAYWTGQIQQTLAAGQFVGSVLVNIMSGAQGQDITTLIGKVAVSLAFVHQQDEHNTPWAGAADTAAATTLLHGVTSDPLSILTGIKNAEILIANHA